MTSTSAPDKTHPHKEIIPYLILMILILGSVLLWQYYKNSTLAREERRYNEYVDQTVARISEQIHHNFKVLKGVAGVFAATAEVGQEEWSAYFEYQKIVTEHPGIRDAVFAKVVQPSELEKHIEALRAEGHLEYTVWPDGEREVYTPVVFVAPFTESYRAGLGFDMYSDPLRRATMEKARDTGVAAISGKMTIITETGPAPPMGFIMIVPVFKKGAQPNAPEERRAAIMGYISSFFRIEELMAGIFTDPIHEIDFHLYDGAMISPETLLYDSHITPEENNGRRPLFTNTKTIDLYGHQWTMVFESMPAFEAVADRNSHWAILGVGLLISFLVFFYLKSLQHMTAVIRKSEEALFISNSTLHLILDTVPQSIFWKDTEGRYLGCNSSFIETAGLKDQNKVIGKTDFDLPWPREEAEAYRSDDKAVMDSKQPKLNIIEPLETAYGSRLWLKTSKAPLFDQDGRAFGVLGVFEDITARKKAEEEIRRLNEELEQRVEERTASLRESEEQLRKITDNVTDVVALCDAEGKVTYLSPQSSRILGYNPEELLGKTVFATVYEEDLPEVMQRFNDSLETEKPGSAEYRIATKDGRLVWVETRGDLLYEHGQVSGAVFVTRDITEHKQLEVIINESKKMYQSVVDTQQEMIARCLPDTTITFVNNALCRALGKSRNELLGQKYLMFLPPEEHEKRMELLSSISPAKPSVTHEDRVLLPDGSVSWQEWTDLALFDENGKVIEIQGVGHVITERKQAKEEARRQARRTEALLKVASHLNAELKLDKVREAICEETCGALNVKMSAYLSYNDNNRRFHLTASSGLPEELARGFASLSREDYDDIIRKLGKAGAIPDLAAVSELPSVQRLLNHNIKSFAYAVVERDGSPLGVIFAGDIGEAVDLSEDAVALLSGLADQAASAVTNARLLQETRARLRQVQALRNIDMAITGSLDLRVTFQIVLDEVTSMLNTDAAAILLLDPHTGTLKYEKWRGFHNKNLNSIILPLGKGYGGRAAAERQAIHIADLSKTVTDPYQGPLLTREGFAAYFAVPLTAKGTVKGVLEVYHRKPVETNGDWLAFMETLAGQAAIAIDNAELFSRLERSSVDLLQAYDATIEGWAHALDLKDEETEAHSQRVTETTVAIARKMNMTGGELAHVRRGALLHDIGKMGIPDSILLKPGKLTDEEWEVMRQHPVHAFNMLSAIDYLRPALDIPYCHHEKWDGTGYPRGLKGKTIPLPARIFALVDFYDALTNARPYRKAWSREETLALMKEESGKHFDPEVVEVFLKEFGNDA
jgi:PAS domain S-box-containing protein